MKGNSEFRLKTYLEDYMRHLQDHPKLRNFNDQTCGVSPFEDANRQSLKSFEKINCGGKCKMEESIWTFNYRQMKLRSRSPDFTTVDE